MKNKLTFALVGLLIAAFLVGCGSSPAPAASTPAKAPAATAASAASAKLVEPCDLVSKTDAQQYISQPLKDAEKKETPVVGLKLCVYNTVSEGSGKLLQIGLTQ